MKHFILSGRPGKRPVTDQRTVNMYRLGIDARPLEHPSTGIGRYTYQIVNQLRRLRDWKLFLFTGAPIKSVWPETTIIPFGVPGIPDLISFQSRVGRLSCQYRLDAFFGPRHQLPARVTCPSVVTIHDLTWRDAPQTMRTLGRLVDTIFMPQAVKQADRIIAVSRHTHDTLIRHLPRAGGKTSVVHEAAYRFPDSHTRTNNLNSPFILSVGTQEPRKNYIRLLASFKQVVTAHPELKLVIVAGRGWKTNLPREIQKNALNDHVILIENVSDNALDGLYAHCEFVAMPSLYEGFGLPLIEAMQHGKAVVTSNLSAMPEVAADAGYLVDPLRVDEITFAISQLMTNRHLRRQLESAARKRCLDFSWEKAGEATAQVIEDAITQHRAD